MKRVYDVKVEWKLSGKNEEYNPENLTIIAENTDAAIGAAIRLCKERNAEAHAEESQIPLFKNVRLAEVSQGDFVDFVVE